MCYVLYTISLSIYIYIYHILCVICYTLDLAHYIYYRQEKVALSISRPAIVSRGEGGWKMGRCGWAGEADGVRARPPAPSASPPYNTKSKRGEGRALGPAPAPPGLSFSIINRGPGGEHK